MLRGKFLAVGVLVLASFAPVTAVAATLEIPEQYPTIAAALADAHPGDTIKIAPGRYHEFGLELPAGVTLTGSGNSAAETVIDAQGQGRILTAKYLDTVSFVQNLTFENGWAQDSEGAGECGGAIYNNGSLLRIFNCRFIGNRANSDGGAISCMKASPLIINCHFENNRAGKGGGALDCSYDASVLVQNSFFFRNSAAYGGALACRGNSHPIFNTCHFDRNTTDGELSHGGAVLSFFWGDPTFYQCTFSRNSADVGGALYSDEHSPTHLTSCTIAGNTGLSYGSGLFIDNCSPEIKSSIIAFQDGIGVLSLGTDGPRISCSNIFGNSGGDWFGNIAPQADAEGNLSVDPIFCQTNLDEVYKFNLQEGSPCTLEAGACADMGAWPVGCETPMETMVGLALFTVVWVDGVPTIVWQVEGGRGPVGFRLARSSLEHPDLEQNLRYTVGANGEFVAQDYGFIPDQNETYVYRLYLLLDGGGEFLLGSVTLGDPPQVLAIRNFGAWPNPFNPQTRVHFELASSQMMQVEVFGIDGRRLRTLANEVFSAGPQDLVWDGRDNNGRVMASGPYIVVVAGEQNTERLKVTLLK